MVARIIILATGGIIPRRSLTGDDATRAAIIRTRCWHRVFLVITTRLARQNTLSVTERLPVLAVWEAGALLNQANNGLRFFGQRDVFNRAYACGIIIFPTLLLSRCAIIDTVWRGCRPIVRLNFGGSGRCSCRTLLRHRGFVLT